MYRTFMSLVLASTAPRPAIGASSHQPQGPQRNAVLNSALNPPWPCRDLHCYNYPFRASEKRNSQTTQPASQPAAAAAAADNKERRRTHFHDRPSKGVWCPASDLPCPDPQGLRVIDRTTAMSGFMSSKRQRSNTSRESSNAIPQTTAPALRQHPSLNGSLALYPAAATSAGYSNGPYAAATQSAAAPSAHHQAVTYASYSAGPVTTQHNGYGSGGYQTSASTTGYGASPYSPQHQANPYANQYTHAQASPQLSPHAGHYAPAGLNGVQNGGYAQSHAHASQATARMTYSPVSANPQTAASYSQPPPQRNNATIAAMQTQPQHGSLSSYGDSYASHTPTHSGQYQTASPSYQDPNVATHYSPAPLPTPQSHDVSRHMSEDLAENDDEDAQGEPADESAELYTNPEPSRAPVSSIPTPSSDQPKPGEMICSCKKGRGKKKICIGCGCSKYGLGCNQACSCGGGENCGNPFADLSAFFGPTDIFAKPCRANPCFATWLRQQPNVEELDVDLMVDMLLSDDESWAQIREYTEAFRQWEEQWKKARNGKGKKNKEERERLEYELLRAFAKAIGCLPIYGSTVLNVRRAGPVPTGIVRSMVAAPKIACVQAVHRPRCHITTSNNSTNSNGRSCTQHKTIHEVF
ncbi:hypothetical protein FHL15_010738 [Xylaria flabelliformis]|uniref:Tesmin/TSO1-like CXC domain-containing protein n=1 Tax=Xylaria flabelliformis TaxID=2512241 RepID=A0A553HK84_9PEZI|nr:hypothetical protein FHL15_010738 [Xylaria flabelliformis]